MSFPKGQHHTEETKEKLRVALLGNKNGLGCHLSPSTRLKMSQSRTGRKVSVETRQKLSLAKIGHPVSADTRLKLSILNKGKKCSPEHIAKNRIGHIGKRHTLETRQKMSERKKADWQNPEWRANNFAGRQRFLSALANDPEWQRRRMKAVMDGLRQVRRRELLVEPEAPKEVAIKQVRLSPEHRAKIGEVKRKAWQDPEWRAKVIQAQIDGRKRAMERDPEWRNKQIKAQRRGYSIFPNKAESVLLELLESDYPSEWAYVGDGSLIIGSAVPDFANVNGKKLLIELFGDHWHRGQNPQDRIDLFKRFGFRTLVVWERELKQLDNVRERVDEFVKGR